MGTRFRHVAATLLLLSFSASIVEAARMPTCAGLDAMNAAAGHAHEPPASDDAGDGAAPGGTNECAMLSTGVGCTVASLPAARYSGDLPLIPNARAASVATVDLSLLLVRDCFHPPRG